MANFIKTFQNIEVPALGFGTFELTGQTCIAGVIDALNIGYRHIDTAQMYNNEQEVGKAIKDSGIARDEIFVTTKIWYTNLEENRLLKSFQRSLRSLKMDYVDLLLIHWPSPDNYPLDKTLGAMFSLKEQGKVKSVGVSNFPSSLLKTAMQYGPIFADQVEYHPYLDQSGLLQLTKRNDAALTAYCPLAKGKTVRDEILTQIGKKYGKSASQVALRWLIQQDNVLAIPRSSKHEHRVSNFEIFDFSLTEDEMREIYQLERGGRMIDPVFGPQWES